MIQKQEAGNPTLLKAVSGVVNGVHTVASPPGFESCVLQQLSMTLRKLSASKGCGEH